MLKHIFFGYWFPPIKFSIDGDCAKSVGAWTRGIRDFLVLVLSENELKIKIASHASFSEFFNF